MTFNGIQRSYENTIAMYFKKNEVVLDRPIDLGFSVLELSKLQLYETYYDILQPHFGQENLQLHYIDMNAFLLNVNTKDIIQYLKKLDDMFDFSNIDDKH